MCYQCWFDTVMEEIENGHLTHVKPRLINWLANRPITYEGRLPPSLLIVTAREHNPPDSQTSAFLGSTRYP
jgi:hypothetical protein